MDCDQMDTLDISLEAMHLIGVWIMKVKGPKIQADFIEALKSGAPCM